MQQPKRFGRINAHGKPTVEMGSPPQTARLFESEEWRLVAEALRFSGREKLIAEGILNDMNEIELAARIGISRHTVHTHTERRFRKVGVRSRLQLVVQIFTTHRDLAERRRG